MIEIVTDEALLRRAYYDILAPSFPDTELITAEEFIAFGAAGDVEVLVARDGVELQGVIVGERHGGGVLVDWLAVASTTRGGGVGGALLSAGFEFWLGQEGVQIVLGEVERPDLFSAHPQYGDPARRFAFYERRGATVLDLPYYQPPMAEDKPRLRGLMLVVLAAADQTPAPRTLTAVETAAVREVLVATMGPALPGDDETALIYSTVDDPVGLRLLPLSDYARIPVSHGS